MIIWATIRFRLTTLKKRVRYEPPKHRETNQDHRHTGSPTLRGWAILIWQSSKIDICNEAEKFPVANVPTGLLPMGAHTRDARTTQFHTIGVIHSAIRSRSNAPKQGAEGAPHAWLEVSSSAAKGLDALRAG